MSRKGQQASAGQGAGMVHAAGAVGEAGLCLEPSVGNGKGLWASLEFQEGSR